LRLGTLAFLFAPLSVVLAIGQPASIVPETVERSEQYRVDAIAVLTEFENEPGIRIPC
jgi:hypothetical protein